jgi:hypothetical protein
MIRSFSPRVRGASSDSDTASRTKWQTAFQRAICHAVTGRIGWPMITFSFSKFRALILAVLFVSPLAAHAQTTYYIREGASGANNGADWTNAFSSLPETLVRGAIYYIADGNYGAYIFDDPVSGTQIITFKKAIASDHGTNVGWSPSYGDGQASFGHLTIRTSYYTIDGQVRNESNWGDDTAYGFDIRDPGRINIEKDGSHLRLQYIDVGAPLGSKWPVAKGRAINTSPDPKGLYPWRTDLYFGHMHMHNFGGNVMWACGEVTFEYCLIQQTFGKNTIRHERGHNWIIRYNKFINCGILETSPEPQTATIGIFNHRGGKVQSDNFAVYGNVFARTAPYPATEHANALILASRVANWKFYNNTIARTDGNWCGGIEIKGTNNLMRNNLWYWMGDYDGQWGGLISSGECNVDASWVYYKNAKPARLGYDGDNLRGTNYIGTEDPFVNEAGLDYRLKASIAGVSPIDRAVDLGAPYNVDANGVSHRNIGAYATVGASATVGQAGGELTAPTIATQPLNATVALAQTTTFSVNATGSTPLSYQWQRDGADIAGATGATYTTPAAISSDNGATFRVVVSNSAGSVTSSDATLTVNTLASGAPALEITSPSTGARFTAPADITIMANASDGDGTILKVEFFNGGTKLGEDSSSPYALTWSGVAAGSYSLTARAIDNLGEMTLSNVVSASVADAAISQSPTAPSAPTGVRIAQ